MGSFSCLDRQTPAGVREPGHGALRLGPAEDRNAPARPVFDALGARVILLLQAQQHDVARCGWTEIRRPPRRSASGSRSVESAIVLALEERLLEIPARTPAQHRLPTFRSSPRMWRIMSCRIDALGGLLVVRAAGRMDVMIARVPARLRRIDPALQAERQAPWARSPTWMRCIFFRYSGPRVYSTV